MAYVSRTAEEEVAHAIGRLTYSEMRSLSAMLADVFDNTYRGEKPTPMDADRVALALAYWAEGVNETFEARKAEQV